MRSFGYCTTVLLVLLSFAALADAPEPLGRQEIIDLVRGNTTECRKEKDQSMCSNYFTKEGVIKRVMHADGKRKDGRWFLDDQTRLCILWDGKIKPLCFSVFEQADGNYNLIKKGKHITTITGIEDGNTKDL
jgi:hypothetical protein